MDYHTLPVFCDQVAVADEQLDSTNFKTALQTSATDANQSFKVGSSKSL
jgi:hypothetical protein